MLCFKRRVLLLGGLALALSGSVACEAPSATISDVGASGAGDDDVTGNPNSSTETTNSGTTSPPDAYPRSWTGERTFFFDWCEDTIYGTGVEVTEEADYTEALAACPECDEIYAVDHSPETICYGYIEVRAESVRGINRSTGSIFEISYRDYSGFEVEELDQGTWDGNTLDYGYLVDEGWDAFEVTGWVTAE